MSLTGFQRRRRELAKLKKQGVEGETPISEKTYEELKADAKVAGIKGYHMLSKQRLIQILSGGAENEV